MVKEHCAQKVTRDRQEGVSSFVDLLLAGTSADIIEPEIRSEILTRVRGLPATLCRGWIWFEFHLDETRGTRGIGFGVLNYEQRLDTLFDLKCEYFGAHADDGRAAIQFLSQLKHKEPAVWAAVKTAWLELDIGSDGFPGLLFTMPDNRCNETVCPPAPAVLDILTHLLDGLPGPDMSSATGRRLSQLYVETQDVAVLVHVGWMIGRGENRLKVDLRTQGAADAVALLERIGLTQTAREVRLLLAGLQSPLGSILLQLDVGDDISPKVGLQVYPSGSSTSLSSMLTDLVDSGLCCSRKAIAISDRASCRKVQPSRWPKEIWDRYDPAGRQLSLVVISGISHFKFSLEPGRPTSVKCYINDAFHWYDQADGSTFRIASGS